MTAYDSRAIARDLLNRKLAPIPVRPRSKKAVIESWQDLQIGPDKIADYFAGSENVGVSLGSPSGWRVDVDLDATETLLTADHFLRPTGAVFGRASKRRSHWVFICRDVKTKKFADPRKRKGKKSMLVELRSTGCQTIAPGSVHPSGERVEWDEDGEPAEVAAEDLTDAVASIAAAALLARYWHDGQRHDAALALAGGLKRLGWSPERIGRFVEAVGHAAGDEEIRDRVRAARDTLEREGNTTGWPTLEKIVGNDIVSKVRDWLGASPDRARKGSVDQLVAVDPHDTELGLARRIVAEHGEVIRYCFPWKLWLVWDGRRWEPDQRGRVWFLAKQTVQGIYAEALAKADSAEREKAIKYALKCEKEATLRAAIGLARSEPGIPVIPEELNRDRWLLNTLSGTVDLRTGQVREHRREDLLTKLCPTPFHPNSQAPTWERFLLRIFDRNLPLIVFVQRAMGYACTGTVREHVLFMLVGPGANGKSTLTSAVIATLGPDYGTQIAPGLLFSDDKDTHPTGIADLYGKRFAVTHELDAGTRLAEGLVKQITGGDRIKARRMKQDFWEFDPTHTLFLCANTKPLIRGSDDGIWRRIRLVPFRVRIPDGEQDKKLPEKLRAEAPGILSWLVQGAQEYLRDGLSEPEEVKEATASYRSESDLVGEFIAARCQTGPEFHAMAADLFRAFKTWYADTLGGDAPSQQSFGRKLSDRGFDRRRLARGYRWRGIGLLESVELDSDGPRGDFASGAAE